jgi:starch phosphorylase
MRASLSKLAPMYSSNRMLVDYLKQVYEPAAASLARRCADGARLARELNRWHTRLLTEWRQVNFGQLGLARHDRGWTFSVPVYLGDILPDRVKVELYAAATEKEEASIVAMTRGASIPGAANGFIYSASVSTMRPAEHFTPRVIAFHPEACVPTESALIAWLR